MRLQTGFDHGFDHGKHGGAIALVERSHHAGNQGVRSEPEQGSSVLIGDMVAGGTADQLVEHRFGVPDRPAPGPHHQGHDIRVHGDSLPRGEVLHITGQGARRHQAERIMMGTRTDGRQHLTRLGGGKDELHMRRRFFDNFEQRVEPLT
jgi:hypothetical protein